MANNPRPSQKNQRRRKLHSIQQLDSSSSKNAAIFWYSYQSALTWIRSHEDVISKCVHLLQIYPNLIQDASMDQFWEFIESLLHGQHAAKDGDLRTESVRPKRYEYNVMKHYEKESSFKGPEIPHISVTESKTSPGPTLTISAQHARTPRVHLISRSKDGIISNDEKYLHVGVIDMLQEDFYIRVTNRSLQSLQDTSKESQRQYVVAESDVCVYLFNSSTLDDPACFHDLCIALAKKIPVVYVRHHKQDLPKTFSETITNNSKGCLTLKDYIEKFMTETRPVSSSNLSVKNTFFKKKLAPLIVGSRSKSASDLYVGQKDGLLGSHARVSESLEIDLVLTLVSNFKNACVFDESDLQVCSSRLRQTIHQVLGICESKQEPALSYSNNTSVSRKGDYVLNSKDNNVSRSNKSGDCFSASVKGRRAFLSVPDPEDLISTREWGHSGSVSSLQNEHANRDYDSDGGRDDSIFFDNDARMASSPTLEKRATTYLIFDQNKDPDGPRKVEFPSELDSVTIDSELESDDYNAANESPVDFHEIDLSREINSRGTPESDVSSVF